MHVRIQGLIDLFPRGSTLIDVGSDHGYLGLELLKQDKADKVINIDLSKDALKRSNMTYTKQGVAERALFLRNDGFTGVYNWPERSCAVIAGMGTSQILRILERLPEAINHLLLLSHTCCYYLRKWAYDNDFFIKNEKYVFDGEYCYLILDMVKDKHPKREWNRADCILGREEFRQGEKNRDLFAKYWKRPVERILRIPYQFRNDLDKDTIRLLKLEKVI